MYVSKWDEVKFHHLQHNDGLDLSPMKCNFPSCYPKLANCMFSLVIPTWELFLCDFWIFLTLIKFVKFFFNGHQDMHEILLERVKVADQKHMVPSGMRRLQCQQWSRISVPNDTHIPSCHQNQRVPYEIVGCVIVRFSPIYQICWITFLTNGTYWH